MLRTTAFLVAIAQTHFSWGESNHFAQTPRLRLAFVFPSINSRSPRKERSDSRGQAIFERSRLRGTVDSDLSEILEGWWDQGEQEEGGDQKPVAGLQDRSEKKTPLRASFVSTARQARLQRDGVTDIGGDGKAAQSRDAEVLEGIAEKAQEEDGEEVEWVEMSNKEMRQLKNKKRKKRQREEMKEKLKSQCEPYGPIDVTQAMYKEKTESSSKGIDPYYKERMDGITKINEQLEELGRLHSQRKKAIAQIKDLTPEARKGYLGMAESDFNAQVKKVVSPMFVMQGDLPPEEEEGGTEEEERILAEIQKKSKKKKKKKSKSPQTAREKVFGDEDDFLDLDQMPDMDRMELWTDEPVEEEEEEEEEGEETEGGTRHFEQRLHQMSEQSLTQTSEAASPPPRKNLADPLIASLSVGDPGSAVGVRGDVGVGGDAYASPPCPCVRVGLGALGSIGSCMKGVRAMSSMVEVRRRRQAMKELEEERRKKETSSDSDLCQ
uniref:Uncharacterized protein n=1 Tax=Chromera velia CCMP2878 TaxID=1169474 RepID=A0A0G4FD11_9ALVE|eukprot:Cvel_16437.t1-p1 / transcript=Cvel_16437.t1 / gene=Cvel_16437 / organism=Chromera_velia_CCMP2878 / gene_product=hypothetical protein / transcript_product=hypothetical protein / location=Cvel_scaffold1267:2227-3702(-) / protein_length=492 / sequence_SO=supercontig / SO=protein_coding / is_pseudo=false